MGKSMSSVYSASKAVMRSMCSFWAPEGQVFSAVTNQLCGMFGIVVGMTGSVQRPWLASGAPAWVSVACQPRSAKKPTGSSIVPVQGAPLARLGVGVGGAAPGVLVVVSLAPSGAGRPPPAHPRDGAVGSGRRREPARPALPGRGRPPGRARRATGRAGHGGLERVSRAPGARMRDVLTTWALWCRGCG